jgi:hypothetical protein
MWGTFFIILVIIMFIVLYPSLLRFFGFEEFKMQFSKSSITFHSIIGSS